MGNSFLTPSLGPPKPCLELAGNWPEMAGNGRKWPETGPKLVPASQGFYVGVFLIKKVKVPHLKQKTLSRHSGMRGCQKIGHKICQKIIRSAGHAGIARTKSGGPKNIVLNSYMTYCPAAY
ncbi:MAG: hypothetical protein LBF22_02140 [Deltaproteobacteria bacterium]|nr:hypothetical protein [Deltaproteobacteria bacterium]